MKNLILYQICLLVTLTAAVYKSNKAKSIGKRSYYAQMRTTRKPIFGDPPVYENDLYKYNNEQDYQDNYNYKKDYYPEKKYGMTSNNGAYGGDITNEDDQSKLSHVRLDVDADSQTDTYKEGGEDVAEGKDQTPYGFIGGGAGSIGYSVNDANEAGLPFVNKQNEQDSNIMDDPYRFHGSGYQSNLVSNTRRTKSLTNCNHEEDAQYYCVNKNDGLYFDPWNPWCGYINCVSFQTQRKVCRNGTWMGQSNVIRFTINEMCRKKLPRGIQIGGTDLCPKLTDYDICKNADQKVGLINEDK